MFGRWLRPTASERLWGFVGALFLLLIVLQLIISLVRSAWLLLAVLTGVITLLIIGSVYLWGRRRREPHYW